MVKLNPEQVKLQTRIKRLTDYHKFVEDLLREAASRCSHVIIDDKLSGFEDEPGVAVCTICQKYFGWYCPDSPDHQCHYDHIDTEGRFYISGDCKFCGDPSERK